MKRKHKTKSKAKALPLFDAADDDTIDLVCRRCFQFACDGRCSGPPKSPHVRRKVTSRVPSGAESTRKGKESKRRAGKSLRRSAAAASL